MRMLHFLSYLSIRSVLLLCSLLPYKALHALGKSLGTLMFPFLTRYRKRALSNLAIASDLKLSNVEIKQLAKESLCNLFITSLEYGKLSRETHIEHVATCINPEEADTILTSGKGIIFFCAHQANWEILFLEGTFRMNGTAIGQPIANTFLYNWVIKMREKFGGVMIQPKQAVKEGLKTLKKGWFLGIVGDQGMPDGGFCCSFLGREAYTSPLPALLSHRSGAPILVATTVRHKGRYLIEYSTPIWPDPQKSTEEDTTFLMNATLQILEKTIKKNPGQWLWQHNKWKQQGPGKLNKKYRHDTMAVFFPLEKEAFEPLLELLKTMREIYKTEWISCFIPKDTLLPEGLVNEIILYEKTSELKKEDFRFKLIFNFTPDRSIENHYLKLAAFEVLSLETIKKRSHSPEMSLSSQLKKVILYAG